MGVIVPAILTPSRSDLEGKLARLNGLVDSVQIDVIDGRFVGPPTWPYAVAEEGIDTLGGEGAFSRLGRFHYEVDLMVQSPEESVGAWISAGANRVLVHFESAPYLDTLITDLAHKYGHDKGFAPDLLSFGIALNIDTDTAVLDPYIDSMDYVQFMGIATIGKQGIPFDRRVLHKIEAFRTKYPDMLIQVDGGVSLETAPDLLSAGASRLVAGSALWKAPDLEEAIKQFDALGEQHGIYNTSV